MRVRKIHPYILIISSFVGVILLGTLFLLLPISAKNNQSIGFIDSLFMSTSAVCVTGLASVSVANELSVSRFPVPVSGALSRFQKSASLSRSSRLRSSRI